MLSLKISLFICGIYPITGIQQWTDGVAATREYPFVVSLICDKSSLCGGSLITYDWILTAAQCLYDPRGQRYQKLVACVGTQRIRYPESQVNCENGHSVPISRMVRHHWYTHRNPYEDNTSSLYDIALLRTEQSIPSKIAQPIRLISPDADLRYFGLECKTLAWVQLDPKKEIIWILKEARIKLLEHADSEIMRQVSRKMFDRGMGKLVSTTMMTGDQIYQGGIGTPLIVWRGRFYVQVGINNNVMAEFSDFTRVSTYIDWIRDTTQEEIRTIN